MVKEFLRMHELGKKERIKTMKKKENNKRKNKFIYVCLLIRECVYIQKMDLPSAFSRTAPAFFFFMFTSRRKSGLQTTNEIF